MSLSSPRSPRWPLDRVKALAVRPDGLRIYWSRALRFLGPARHAAPLVRATLRALDESSFAHTVQLREDVADVYGVQRRARGWYLEIALREEDSMVLVISFHPLERPLETNGGLVRP